jgi:hypothetical protein
VALVSSSLLDFVGYPGPLNSTLRYDMVLTAWLVAFRVFSRSECTHNDNNIIIMLHKNKTKTSQ